MITRNSLAHTKIEYILNPDGTSGYSWPIFTGCEQPPEVCLTRATCWARMGHTRFGKAGWAKLYNPDFSLKFNEQLLEAPLHLRKPSAIAVGFGGDVFGPGAEWGHIKVVLEIVSECPQHVFLFLTKSPQTLSAFNPWPPNAWVGWTVTGAEPFEILSAKYHAFLAVEGGKRWISYEPMLGKWRLWWEGIDWFVAGEQTGPGWLVPKLEWVWNLIKAADAMKIPIWLKTNLLKLYPQLPQRQERPWS